MENIQGKQEILDILTAPVNMPGGIKLACKAYREMSGCTWAMARKMIDAIIEEHLVSLYGSTNNHPAGDSME